MYENYSRQALPEKQYRELLGSALCVFNSNNSFIIENILKNDISKEYNWYALIDLSSGDLEKPIKETITRVTGSTDISNLFSEIVTKRNRIMHSFQVTDKNKNQILATKDKSNKQYLITEELLLDFIKKNEKLSSLLHSFRGY